MALAEPQELVKTLCEHESEAEWYEFKRGMFDPTEFGQYVSALANAAMLADKRHAFLVFGVDNESHEIVGTTVNLRKEKKGGEPFENWLSRMISPAINVSIDTCFIDGKRVEIASIEPSYDRPVKFSNVGYIRIGENKRRLEDFPEKERALWALTNRHTFEQGIAATHIKEDDIRVKFLWRGFCNIYYPNTRSWENFIESLLVDGLIHDDLQGGFDVTNLFAILAARDLRDFKTVSHKAGRVVVFKGKDKTHGIDDITGQNGYALTFPRMLTYIMDKLSGKEIFIHGVRRREQFYPEIAIREFLANALIHQDLNASGSRPTVEIYQDKVKIFNLGKPFVEPARIIDAPPRSRNERLAWFMQRAGHCEERGSGIVRALWEIEAAGQAPPLFQVVEDSYSVTLFKTTDFGAMSRDDRVRACYQHAVLRHLRGEPMNNSSLRARLGLKSTQASQASNVIKDAQDDNLIKPLDPNQGYRIAKYVPTWA